MTTSKSPSKPGLFQRLLLGWLPFIFWNWVVFESAVVPPGKIPDFLRHFNDKFIHGSEYFVLALFALNLFAQSPSNFVRQNPYRFALIYGMIMGAVTELSQLRVPGRSCDFQDWMADVTGTLLALVLILIFKPRRIQ